MAEIALLVAEEYERMKRWHSGEVEEDPNCALFTYFASLGAKKEKTEIASPVRREAMVVVAAVGLELKKALEPRSPLGLAAMEGFFPA